eukprot:8959716-Alexandrium_andersonii.AAC.1
MGLSRFRGRCRAWPAKAKLVARAPHAARSMLPRGGSSALCSSLLCLSSHPSPGKSAFAQRAQQTGAHAHFAAPWSSEMAPRAPRGLECFEWPVRGSSRFRT